MQSTIPRSLEDRLDVHLIRVREGVGEDDDILPAVFAMLLEQQKELALAAASTAVSLGAAVNEAAQVSGRQFELVFTRQMELERVASNTAAKLGSVLKAIEGLADMQSATDARLEVLQREVVKRANVALSIQILGVIILVGAIAFLMFRR